MLYRVKSPPNYNWAKITNINSNLNSFINLMNHSYLLSASCKFVNLLLKLRLKLQIFVDRYERNNILFVVQFLMCFLYWKKKKWIKIKNEVNKGRQLYCIQLPPLASLICPSFV